jgi:hypothetical protein
LQETPFSAEESDSNTYNTIIIFHPLSYSLSLRFSVSLQSAVLFVAISNRVPQNLALVEAGRSSGGDTIIP